MDQRGRRLLLTCALRHLDGAPQYSVPELSEDISRIVELFCGDFQPPEARYRHVDMLGDSPTSIELQDRLRAFSMDGDVTEDDVIVLYLTGHGEFLRDGDHVLLTRDAHVDDLLRGTVRTADLVRMLVGETHVRTLLVMLDTCYSGAGSAGLAHEALRRIPSSEGGQGDTGITLISATRPKQEATAGAFSTALFRAARSLSAAGSAAPVLATGALMSVMREDREKLATQDAVRHEIGMSGREPAFLVNPRFRSELVDVDLLQQDRARFAEQRESQIRQRFMPATRMFTGRHQVLLDIAAWLREPQGPPLCVVTGLAGSGKTAVLGLLSALADPDRAPSVPRQELPVDLAVPAACFAETVYAGSMATEEVLDRLAGSLGQRVRSAADLAHKVRDSPADHVVFLIDALDEAADPEGLISTLIKPLLQASGRKVRVLLGTRPHLWGPRLFSGEELEASLIDLDSPTYADADSIKSFARKLLLVDDELDGEYRPSGLYRTLAPELLGEISSAIAEAAGDSFLVARITAMTEAVRPVPPDPYSAEWRRSLPRHAGTAMQRDLEYRLGDRAHDAEKLLRPLAYAFGGGMPWEDVWAKLAKALSPDDDVTDEDLIWLRRSAGSYVVEGSLDGRSVYRIFHQALVDHLRQGRDPAADHQRIVEVLERLVPGALHGSKDWASAHPYSRHHLAEHAAASGDTDRFLLDPGYLLTAMPAGLMAAAPHASSEQARRAATAYRYASSRLRLERPDEHAAYLRLAALCAGAHELADGTERFRSAGAAWWPRWASYRALSTPSYEVNGHPSPSVVATTQVDNEPMVISSNSRSKAQVRVGSLTSGQLRYAPFALASEVESFALLEGAGSPTAFVGCADGVVRSFDVASGVQGRLALKAHQNSIHSLCVVNAGEGTVLLTGASERFGRFDRPGELACWELWPGDSASLRYRVKTQGPVGAMVSHTIHDAPLLVLPVGYGRIEFRDLHSGEIVGEPYVDLRRSGQKAFCTRSGERDLLLISTIRGTIALDLRTRDVVMFGQHSGSISVARIGGQDLMVLEDHRQVEIFATDGWDCVGVCDLSGYRFAKTHVVEMDGQPAVLAVSADSMAVLEVTPPSQHLKPRSLWTPLASATPATSGQALSLAEVDPNELEALVTDDWSIQLQRVGDHTPVGARTTGHRAPIKAVGATVVNERDIVISASEDHTLSVNDLASGSLVTPPLRGHSAAVTCFDTVGTDTGALLVSGGASGRLILHDLSDGKVVHLPVPPQDGPIEAVLAFEARGRTAIACVVGARAYGSRLKFFDLETGGQIELTSDLRMTALASVVWMRFRPSRESPQLLVQTPSQLLVLELNSGEILPADATDPSSARVRPHVRMVPAPRSDPQTSIDAGQAATEESLSDQRADAVAIHDHPISAVAFGHDSQGSLIFISGDTKGGLRAWDPDTGLPGTPLPADHREVTCLVPGTWADKPVIFVGFATDNDYYDERTGTVKVVDLGTGSILVEVEANFDGDIRSMVIHDQQLIVAWQQTVENGLMAPSDGGRVTTLSLESLEVDEHLNFKEMHVPRLGLIPTDGTLLVTIGQRVVQLQLPGLQRRFLRHAPRWKRRLGGDLPVSAITTTWTSPAIVLVAMGSMGGGRVEARNHASGRLEGAWDFERRVNALSMLSAHRVAAAAGRSLHVLDRSHPSAPRVVVNLDSEIRALATHRDVVVLGTDWGLVAVEIAGA